MNEVEPVAAPTRLVENGPLAEEQWKPSRQQCLTNYEVKIRFLSIGCVISVGCKEIPFTTIKEGMEALNEYVARPYESQQAWENRFLEEEK